jgi:hypothetical protein
VITALYLPPAPVGTISEIVRMVALMDTLALYDQFRTLLGEEGAKRFAQTIGTMIEDAKNAVTKRDFVELRESFESHSGRLDAALARLAEAQVRTEERVGRLEAAVAGLAEAQARTEERVGRLEAAVAGLAEAQARTEKSLRELTEIVKGLSARSDRHEGTLLELKFRDRLPSYLGLYLRRAKVLQPADLLDALEPRLERADVEDFLRADVLAQGLVDGAATYVIGEVSYTADANDVERAARRAALLRKADLPAVGLVACEAVHPQTIAYAREQGVRVWADGRLVDERPS